MIYSLRLSDIALRYYFMKTQYYFTNIQKYNKQNSQSIR